MASLLLTGLSRFFLALIRPRTPSSTPTKPPPKTYEELLITALSKDHPLNPRHKLTTSVLTSLLTPQTQLVDLSPGPLPQSTHTPTYVIDEVTPPPTETAKGTAASRTCLWYSRLVQTSFDWTVRSVWFIPLDASLLSEDLLDRHFRMIGTLSTSDSRGVVVYPACEVLVDGIDLRPPFGDIESFMKLCGFNVESNTSLAEVSEVHIPKYEEYMNAMKIAIIQPAPRSPSPGVDTMSEITCSSNDPSSQASEFEDFMSCDRRMVRFELDTSTIPAHLATQENEVVVIGSESCVGCWDPHHAKRMSGRIDAASILVADVMVGLSVSDVEYKYAIVRDDHIVEWETGWNRSLKDGDMVRDEWRC